MYRSLLGTYRTKYIPLLVLALGTSAHRRALLPKRIAVTVFFETARLLTLASLEFHGYRLCRERDRVLLQGERDRFSAGGLVEDAGRIKTIMTRTNAHSAILIGGKTFAIEF